jgi:predicted 2-oxoglutarate/Fe(II)-dependent dioxygenase YbiX
MRLIEHAEGVYEIEDFLDKKMIMASLSEAEEDLYWKTINTGNTFKSMGDELFFKMGKLYKNIETFFTNIESITYSRELRRLRNSEFMWPHKDGGNPDDPMKIVFGIAIYLNDNFHGGELIYPDLGLSITPKAGSMVIHSSHLKHQVFPVVTGVRYSITSFVFGDESTKFKGPSEYSNQ